MDRYCKEQNIGHLHKFTHIHQIHQFSYFFNILYFKEQNNSHLHIFTHIPNLEGQQGMYEDVHLNRNTENKVIKQKP